MNIEREDFEKQYLSELKDIRDVRNRLRKVKVDTIKEL